MHILYMHQYYQTRSDYGATRSYELARFLARQGHRVTVITGDRSYQSGNRLRRSADRHVTVEESDGIRVIRVGVAFSYRRSFLHRAGAFAAYALLSLWASLRTGKVDVVFATSPPLTAGVAGVIVAFLKRAPLVFEVRDLWPEVIETLGVVRSRLPLALLDAMASTTYRLSRLVVAVTPGIQRWLVERRGLPAEKVQLITQGSDLDLFACITRDEARERLSLEDQFVVLYAGAMGIANELAVLVEAMRHVDGAALCLIIGEGMEKDRLKRLADRLGVENIRFLDGVARSEVVWYMAAADVGVISLRSCPVFGTALPNKFFDYIAAGLPIVVNFPGDLAELIEQEGIGRYGGDNDPAALAEVLQSLRDDRHAAVAQGRRARQLAETVYNRPLQSEKLEALLASVVHDQKPKG